MSSIESIIRDTAIKLLEKAATDLPEDVEKAIRNAYEREVNPMAKSMLKSIIDNIHVARKWKYAVCQDTGIVIFYVKADPTYPLLGRIPSLLREATIKATDMIPLRPNAVDPFTGRNSGDNTGRHIPWIEWDLVEGLGYLEITAVLKGGGSEAPSIARTLTPAEGVKGLVKTVLETIYENGAKPCPPVVVGVGIGPTADIAMNLAKKAIFLRPLGVRSDDPNAAKLEELLLEAINKMGLGTHGVGGVVTALDVHVEYAYRHVATYSVGVMVSCWALRRASARIYPNGKVEYLTHREVS
ncbi:MAG: fumarate hydratase [Sulfolobales archaeon]